MMPMKALRFWAKNWLTVTARIIRPSRISPEMMLISVRKPVTVAEAMRKPTISAAAERSRIRFLLTKARNSARGEPSTASAAASPAFPGAAMIRVKPSALP